MRRAARSARRQGGVATMWAIAALCAFVPIRGQSQARAPSQRAPSVTGGVEGMVVDDDGRGIADADVRIANTPQRTTTDTVGRFVFASVPMGGYVLLVRRLGFRPVTLAVAASPPTLRLTVRMTALAQQLAEVSVEGRAEAYRSRLAGFEERRSRRVGHFITREQIDRHAGSNVTDLLRELPGVRVGRLNGLDHAVRLRGAPCAPLVYLDGHPARAFELDLDDIEARSVEGIEVYASGSSIPQQFIGTGAELHCGVIVIWSRPARAPGEPH